MGAPRLRFKGFSDEWKTGQLRNNFSTISTNSYSRSLLNYHTGDVKNIHYGDIHVKFKSHFKVSSENVPYINDDVKITYREECYCRKGDLIFADASEDLNDIGKSIEIIDTNDEKILAGLHTVHLRSLGNEFATGFGGYLLKTNSLIKQIQREAQGAKVLGISASKILGLTYYSPSIKEQQKIADFLTSVDEKINLLKKKKELLEQYKKGVMQKIFSQELRFKDEQGNDFPEWEVKKLGEVFTHFKGNGLSKDKLVTEGQYPCILYGELYTTYKEQVFEIKSSTDTQEGLASKTGDLLMPNSTTTTGIDLANFTALNFENVLLGGDITVLRALQDVSNVFYAYYFSNYMKYELAGYSQGSTIIHLYYSHIKNLEIKLPSITEQEKIADFLTALDKKIDLVNQQITKTELWKKGLLQKMFV